MKTTLDIQHAGTLGSADRHRMSFDAESVTQLMGVLTDLYKDQAAAVIREYVTNAMDAQRAAGNPAPVEIERPDAMNPLFVVRDKGVGMSLDQILNEYSKYGFSSKRDSDEQVGMLGLGCKSGLTYTSQFTLTARKDGREVIVLITRDADGCGVVQIVNEGDTDQPNGVEVSLPVRGVHDFNRKIDHFARFVNPGTLLVDGEALPTVWEDKLYRQIDPDVLVSESGENWLVMGGVAYPIEDKHQPFWVDPNVHYRNFNRSGIIARVGIGAVNFTPSREALRYTKRTLDTLATLKDYVLTATLRVAKADVAAAPTATEALVRAQGWKGTIQAVSVPASTRRGHSIKQASPFVWGDQEVPLVDHYALPDDQRMAAWSSYSRKDSVTEGSMRNIPLNPNDRGEKPVLITNYPLQVISKQVKERMEKWLEAAVPSDAHGRREHHRFYLFSEGTIPLPWWEGVPTVDYPVIQKIELPRVERKPARPKDHWNTMNKWGNLKMRALTDDEAKGRIIISHTDQPYDLKDAYEYLFGLIPATYVRVPKPQMAKFMEQFPHAEEVTAAIKKDSGVFWASVTEAEWFTYKHSDEITAGGLLSLKASRVLDPDLKRILAAFNVAREDIWMSMNSWNNVLKVCRMTTIDDHARSLKVSDLGLAKAEARYPLSQFLTQSRYVKRQNVYVDAKEMGQMLLEYVNGVYLMREQKRLAHKARMARLGLAGRRRMVRKAMWAKRTKARKHRAAMAEAHRRAQEKTTRRRLLADQVKRESRRVAAEKQARYEAGERKRALQRIADALARTTPSPPCSNYTLSPV